MRPRLSDVSPKERPVEMPEDPQIEENPVDMPEKPQPEEKLMKR